MRKLEIGSGNRPLPGYEHLDINSNCPCLEYVCEMHQIPVEDNIFDEIISVHVLEHQPWKMAKLTLTEWIRVLKPGGTLRIVTPNLRWIAQTYLAAFNHTKSDIQKDINVMNAGEQSWLQLNGTFLPSLWANFKIMSSGNKFDQHYACYDSSMLTQFLLLCGANQTYIVADNDSLIVECTK